MQFKKLNGYAGNSSFISILIEGGDSSNSIGDQLWINKEGTELQISENADDDVIQEAIQMFDRPHQRAFKGALIRMGITGNF